MKTTIISNQYKNGKRTCEQTVEYTKADDLQMLGRLQINLAGTLTQIAKTTGTEPMYERYVRNVTNLENAIKAQQAIVDAYDKEE